MIAVAPPSQVSFVGRTREIGLIRSALEKSRRGDPQVVILCGEAGMGKSRLAREAITIATGTGFQVISGRCVEDGPVPFMPFSTDFAEHLNRAHMLNAETLGPAAATLAGYLWNSQGLRHITDDPDRAELARAIPNGFFALARRRPVLFVIDDLQWADGGALSCIHLLVLALCDEQRQRPVRAMIVAIVREPTDERTASVIERLAREPIVTRINVTGLPEIDAAALVEEACGVQSAPRLLTDLIEATSGNPLLILESLEMLARGGALAVQAGRLVSSTRVEEVQAAPDLTREAAENIAAAPPDVANLLVFASLLGEEFSVVDLVAASGQDEDTILAALDHAARIHLVGERGSRLGFSHPSIRRAFAESILLQRRKRLHVDIAQRLELSGRQDSAAIVQIGFHYLAASGAAPAQSAGPALVQAADAAAGLGASDRAAGLYEGAFALIEYVATLGTVELANLESRCGLAHGRNGDTSAARQRFGSAMARSRAAGDIELWGQAFVGWAKSYTYTGARLSPSAFGEFLAVADEERFPAVRARVLAELSSALWLVGDPADLQTAAEAFRLAELSGDALAGAHAGVSLGLARLRAFDLAGAVNAFRATERFAREFDSPAARAWGPVRLAIVHVFGGELRAARSAAQEGERESRIARDWGQVATALAAAASAAALDGRFDETERASAEAVLCLKRSEYRPVSPMVFSTLAWGRFMTGRFDAGRDALEEWKPWGGASASWMYAMLFDTPEHAVERSLPGPLPWRRGVDANSLGVVALVPHVCAAAGMPLPDGYPLAVLAQAHAMGLRFTHSPPLNILRAVGVAEVLDGRPDEGRAFIQTALTECREAGARAELGMALTDLGRAELGVGDRAAAATSIAEGLAIFEELGAWGAHRHALQLATSNGVALEARFPAPAYPGGLTEDAMLVLTAFAAGKSVAVIANELVMDERTVRSVLEGALRRTGNATAESAAVYLDQHGIDVAARRPASAQDLGARRSVDLAFLFEDIDDSSVLNEALGDDRYYELLSLHNQTVEGAIALHGGSIVKHTGDGYFATFPDTPSALRCALEIQSRFPLTLPGESDRILRVAVGVHAGEGVAARGDVFGIAVTKSARIWALAEAGEVLVSELARQRVPEGHFRFIDRGGVPLKGFSGPTRIYQVYRR